jgi:ankyrin repeat protein
MKILLTLAGLLAISVANSQKIKDIIKSGTLESLKKYEAKGGDIYSGFELEYVYEEGYEPEWTYMYPMAYAAGCNKTEIVDYYIANKDKSPELEWWSESISQAFIAALSTKNETLIQKIYEQGPDVNALCEACHGQNAIMVASAYDLEEWYFKLKPVSNLYAPSVEGNTLLHVASVSSSHRIFEDVLMSGLYDPNALNYQSFTALDMAAQSGNFDFFQHLLEQGADINKAPMIWWSAAYSGNMEIFNYLKERAPLNGIFNYDEEMDLPLYVAMSGNHTEMTEQLVDLMLAETVSNYDRIDQYTILDNEVHPLWWAIDSANKTTYEAFLRFASATNTQSEDYSYIPVYRWLTKEANKVFGKDYVAELYEKYSIVEI